MKLLNIERSVVASILGLLFCLSATHTVSAQTEKLGTVAYTPVSGWKKTAKENIVTYSSIDESTGKFGIITLYGATPGTGKPQTDFTREWNNLLVKPFGAKADPKTETESEDGWTSIAGGGAIEFQGAPSVAFLNVFSGHGVTVSILGIFNDEAHLSKLVSFSTGINIEKPVAVAAAPAAASASAPARTENGRLIIPMPTRQLTAADLAGQWGANAGITTTYVDRYTGTYAGFESLHFTDKMTFTGQGEYYSDFFALQNGRKIKEKTSGTFGIAGRILVIQQGNTSKYVIRGWLELPEMTIIEVCGPLNDEDIPKILANPAQGANLDKTWVRKR